MSLPLHDGAVQIFDVDHGQCALITIPNGDQTHRVLIDCGHATNFRGQGPWYPGQQLKSIGVTHIDLLVCTNFDEDHASGFPDFLRQGITIGCILGNPTVPPEVILDLKTQDGMGAGIAAVAAVLAERRRLGHQEIVPDIPFLNLAWAWNPYPRFEDENNLSLILIAQVHQITFLFPGDMETAGFRHMLTTCDAFAHRMPSIDVLIASHHGRENGICSEMFDTYGCSPQIVIISDDRKQYDTQNTSDFYRSKAQGIEGFREIGTRFVLTTRHDGEIIFSFNAGSCTVL